PLRGLQSGGVVSPGCGCARAAAVRRPPPAATHAVNTLDRQLDLCCSHELARDFSRAARHLKQHGAPTYIILSAPGDVRRKPLIRRGRFLKRHFESEPVAVERAASLDAVDDEER